MLKIAINFLIVLLLAENAIAIDYFEKGDTLWVWANSGLKIREKPNIKSKSLGSIPFKSFVIAKESRNTDYNYSIKVIKEYAEYPSFSLNGFWSEVEFNGISGFVFDGYLSSLKPFDPVIKENGLKDMFATLNNAYGEIINSQQSGLET